MLPPQYPHHNSHPDTQLTVHVRVQLYQPTIYETGDFYESYETDNLQSACLHYVGCTDHVIVTLTPGVTCGQVSVSVRSGPGVGTASWEVLS